MVYGCFAWICIHAACDCNAYEGQKRVFDPVDLEYRLMLATLWVLKTQPGFSTKATRTLNIGVISPTLSNLKRKSKIYTVSFNFFLSLRKYALLCNHYHHLLPKTLLSYVSLSL